MGGYPKKGFQEDGGDGCEYAGEEGQIDETFWFFFIFVHFPKATEPEEGNEKGDKKGRDHSNSRCQVFVISRQFRNIVFA